MTDKSLGDQTRQKLAEIHPAIPELTNLYNQGKILRREFLRTATLLGLSASSAYALAGWIDGRAIPAAQGQERPKFGGTLRIVMNVKEISHPAVFDWSEKANLARLVIEPLVKIGEDNIARPHLLERWQPSADLTQWILKLRPNIFWSNGDPLTADDVIFNFTHWLNPATGSSNISRFFCHDPQRERAYRNDPGSDRKTRRVDCPFKSKGTGFSDTGESGGLSGLNRPSAFLGRRRKLYHQSDRHRPVRIGRIRSRQSSVIQTASNPLLARRGFLWMGFTISTLATNKPVGSTPYYRIRSICSGVWT